MNEVAQMIMHKASYKDRSNNSYNSEKKTGPKPHNDPVSASDINTRLLADSLPVIFWIADKDGKPQYFNPHWFEYTGYTEEESLGSGLLIDLVHENDKERVKKHWEQSLKTGKDMEIEYRLKNKSGDYKWFLRKVNAVKNSNGVIINWVGACTDIDEQKKLEQGLIESTERLERRVEERTRELRKSNEDLEQFAFVASHDLKEPLRVIASYSNLIIGKSEGNDPELQEFCGYVQDGVKQMTSLINDLLDYSRVGRFDTQFSPIDLNALVNNVLDSLSNTIHETNAEIKIDALPEISASPTLIRQLFQNLIENAIKFRKKGVKPVIHVSAAKQNKQWLFAVKDNGIGIDPRFADKIFITFQRLHTRENYNGTGIGLSICKKVVEFYHGTIWVDSKPDEGSTFYFTLPDKTAKPQKDIMEP